MAETDDQQATPLRLAHGQVCYLQIPATDIPASVAFYQAVFGWTLDPPTSFYAPSLIGQWVDDRPPADGGVLLWIHVDSIDEALRVAAASGGSLLEHPTPDGPRWLATLRDPAGNAVGVVQHGPR